jgi:hypothetical protein
MSTVFEQTRLMNQDACPFYVQDNNQPAEYIAFLTLCHTTSLKR